MEQVIKYKMTISAKAIHSYCNFIEGIFFFLHMIGDTKERFIFSIFYFVLLGVLWVLETIVVLGKHAHKEVE